MRVRQLVLAAAAAGVFSPPAEAVDFVLTPAGDMPQTAIDGFNAAAARWKANLSNPITIRINIDFVPMGEDTLGTTLATQFSNSPTTIRNALTSHATSTDDLLSVANLQAGASLKLLINRTANSPNGSGSPVPYIDNDGDLNNTRVKATRANLKALGLPVVPANGTDASISFNSDFQWDFDPRDGISAGKYDFVGIATHEIGHTLGFLSGVDVLDNTSGASVNDDALNYVTALDLFRQSTDSFNQGALDWTADKRVKYFSIDGGTTSIAQFSTGEKLGDGRQAGHWKDNMGLGIMDPTAAGGELLAMTENDRRIFDVLGYTRNMTWRWIEPAGGAWQNTINWDAFGIPSSSINGVFDLNGQTYAVAFNANASARELHFISDAVTLNLGGNALAASGDLTVANTAGKSAMLTINGGIVTAQAVHVGGRSAGPGGTGNLTVASGGTLNIAGALRIWNTPGSAVNNTGGAISAGSIINEGTFIQTAGTLTISDSFTNNGMAVIGGIQNWGVNSTMTANGGSVDFDTDSGGMYPPRLSVFVNPSAAVNFNSTHHLRSLHMNGGNSTIGFGGDKTLVTDGLVIDPTAKLDVTDNSLIVHSDAVNRLSVLDNITGLIALAREDGTWGGNGISSMAAVLDSSHLTGLAVMLNERDGAAVYTMFEDEAVDANAILVRYTWNGDTDLSGGVDADDYFRIDSGFAGALTGYANGDFDYSGLVDADDYFMIDSSFAGQTGALGGISPNAVAAPEPGIAGLAACMAGLLTRRKKWNCRTAIQFRP